MCLCSWHHETKETRASARAALKLLRQLLSHRCYCPGLKNKKAQLSSAGRDISLDTRVQGREAPVDTDVAGSGAPVSRRSCTLSRLAHGHFSGQQRS